MAVHDARIIDFLDNCEKLQFSGVVFRAALKTADPLAPSLRGGRWMIPNTTAVLYTSCMEDGAMAEIAHNFSRFDPTPPSDIHIHEIQVATKKTARLSRGALSGIGLTSPALETSLAQTQRIGAAAAFLQYDGIIVPCLRWNTDKLILFADAYGFDSDLAVATTRGADWVEWRRTHSLSFE